MEHYELSVLVLLAVAAAVAVLSSRARLPYAIGLVLAGLLLGNLMSYDGPHLSKDLLFLIVLPGLLFEAAFQIHFAAVWRARALILSLAVPGLVVVTLLTALLVWWGVNQLVPGTIEFIGALVFGALISATDPISVLAIFRNLGVDPRLAVVVEAESLFNDGTAIVVFTIVLGMAAGGDFSIGAALWEFVRVTVLAIGVGAAVGVGVSLLTRSINDPMVEITLTVLSAYGAFIVGELLGLSGVIACVVAGMITGNWGAPRGMQAATRAAVDAFWSYGAFVLNSLVFLLMGLEINVATMVHYVPEILIGWLAITLARATLVYSKYLIMRIAGREGLPWSWATVLTWGGLRGGLSMVLALSLPRDFVHRDLILHMTFGVVLLTLLVQGLTIRPLLRRVGLASGSKLKERLHMSRLRVASFSVSVDGYGAGPDQSVDNPLGVGGMALHDWAFTTRTFRQMFGDQGGATGVDDEFAARGFRKVGAWIMGRNMFGPVRGPWPDETWKGWWGTNPPYHVPVFVLTHHARASCTMNGGTIFHFVTDGIQAALRRATEAAAGLDVRLGGGVATVREYLQARLVDEMHLAISPVALGGGEHLFTGIDLPRLGYKRTEHVPTQNATHVVFTKRR